MNTSDTSLQPRAYFIGVDKAWFTVCIYMGGGFFVNILCMCKKYDIVRVEKWVTAGGQ